MKKLLSTVLFSAVALSAVALSKPSHVSAATKNTETATVSAPASDKTEADVTYNGGATTVWTSPTAGQQVKRYVTTGEHVKFVNSKKVFAEIWYETEDHGWIPERYLSINTLQQLAPLTKKADAAAAPTQTTSLRQLMRKLHQALLLRVPLRPQQRKAPLKVLPRKVLPLNQLRQFKLLLNRPLTSKHNNRLLNRRNKLSKHKSNKFSNNRLSRQLRNKSSNNKYNSRRLANQLLRQLRRHNQPKVQLTKAPSRSASMIRLF